MIKLFKKLFTPIAIFSMALGVTISLNAHEEISAKAASSLYTTADFTLKTTASTAYNNTWDYGTDWTIFGGANNNKLWAFMKFGGKNTTLASANPTYVYNKNAMGVAISKISVVLNAGTLTVGSINSWGVKVYSDSNLTTQIDISSITNMATKTAATYDFIPSPAYQSAHSTVEWPAASYYQVFFDCSNTSTTNGIVWVDKVLFYNDVSFVNVESVTLTDPTSSILAIGESVNMAATVLPIGATDKSLLWESDNSSIIEVNQNGMVTAVSYGTATITVSSISNPSAKDTYLLQVNGTSSKFDKTFTATDFGMLTTYVDGNYLDDGILFYAYQVMKNQTTNALQFRGNPQGYLYNKTAYPQNISKITFKLGTENIVDTYSVYAGTAANPDSTVTVSGVVDPTNNKYVTFDFASLGSFTFFKIFRTSTTGTLYVDGISVQMTDTELESARSYATSFLTTLNDECFNQNVSSVTWTTLSNSYNSLTSDAKLAFTGDNSTVIVTDIQRSLERYTYIVQKYGYANFIGLTISSPSPRVIATTNNQSTNLVTLVLIGTLGLSSILGYYFLNKKKDLLNQ